MLVRLPDDTLRDLPDDVAALILADPSYDDDLSDFTSNEVNVVIHGILGTLFLDNDKAFDDVIDDIRRHYSSVAPSEARIAAAHILIKKYHIEVPDDEVGMVDPRDMFQFSNDSTTLPPND